MCWLFASRAAELAFAARTVRRMSGGCAGRKGCEARHNQLAQLSSTHGRATQRDRQMRALFPSAVLDCAVWCAVVWCAVVQRDAGQHPAANAIRYDAKLLMGNQCWKERVRRTRWVDETDGWLCTMMMMVC